VTWPFLLRAVHNAQMAEAESRVNAANFRAAQAESQAEYWRKRAELFIDRASARVGLTHEPVMRETPVASPSAMEASSPFAGIGLHVFDSTTEDGRPKQEH
jgi:hypothetical protein